MHNNSDNQISDIVKANHHYVHTKELNQPYTSKSTNNSNRKLLEDIFAKVAQPIMMEIKQMHQALHNSGYQPPTGFAWIVRVEQVRCHNDPNNLNNHSHPNLRMQNNTHPKPTRMQNNTHPEPTRMQNNTHPKPTRIQNNTHPKPTRMQNNTHPKSTRMQNNTHPKPTRTENNTYQKPTQGNTNNASNDNKITKTFDKKDMEVIQILAKLKQIITNKLTAEQNNKITPKNKPKTVINLIDEERTINNINSFQHSSTINKHQKKTQTHPTTKKESQKFSILNTTTSNNGCSNITSKYTTQPFINNTKVNPSLHHSTTSNKSMANAQSLPMTLYRNSDDNNSKLNTTSGTAINKNQNPRYTYPYPPYSSNSPFECPTCNKKFQFNSNLQKHMDIHLREKPHQCHTCLKSFNTKILCKKHHYKCKNMINHDRNLRRHTTK